MYFLTFSQNLSFDDVVGLSFGVHGSTCCRSCLLFPKVANKAKSGDLMGTYLYFVRLADFHDVLAPVGIAIFDRILLCNLLPSMIRLAFIPAIVSIIIALWHLSVCGCLIVIHHHWLLHRCLSWEGSNGLGVGSIFSHFIIVHHGCGRSF